MSRRFRRRPPAWCWLTLLVAAAIAYRWGTSASSAPFAIQAGEAVVTSVVDGRTLLVRCQDHESTPVRLLGVLPQDEISATAWLRESLVDHEVRIELDHRRRDRDGTPLAYVYHQGSFVNAQLIRRGWAKAEGYPGDSASHARLLREAVAAK